MIMKKPSQVRKREIGRTTFATGRTQMDNPMPKLASKANPSMQRHQHRYGNKY